MDMLWLKGVSSIVLALGATLFTWGITALGAAMALVFGIALQSFAAKVNSVGFWELLEFFAAFVAAKIKSFLFPGQGQSLADRDIGAANRVLDHFFYGLALAVEAPRSRCGRRAFEQPFEK